MSGRRAQDTRPTGLWWARAEAACIGALSVSCGLLFVTEADSNFDYPVWSGVTTLMPIWWWGLVFVLVGASVLGSLLARLAPTWALLAFCVVSSAFSTTLFLAGQSPDASTVVGLGGFATVVWAGFVIARLIDLLHRHRLDEVRRRRSEELASRDAQAERHEENALESSNDVDEEFGPGSSRV